MTTDLPHGTPIVFKYGGRYELWEVKDDLPPPHQGQKAYSRCFRDLTGEVVHRCVWKANDTLVSRETYTVQPGDSTWNGVAPQTLTNLNFAGPISKHTFAATTPKWLREAS